MDSDRTIRYIGLEIIETGFTRRLVYHIGGQMGSPPREFATSVRVKQTGVTIFNRKVKFQMIPYFGDFQFTTFGTFLICIQLYFPMFHHGRGDNIMVYPLNQIPRQQGKIYQDETSGAVDAKAKMLYLAMFDEMVIRKIGNTEFGPSQFNKRNHK
jgi:hypothetical protein